LEQVERIAYVCRNCNFEFSRKSNIVVKRCPYCGKEGTVEVKSKNYASKLIEDI
jgi:DNA-directed RNA polymerase subunit RPC12/RpoP